MRYTDATQTKTVDGVTYYLYQSAEQKDGTSDAIKDIAEHDLKTMAAAEYSWWCREGFTAKPDTDCKVLANGNAIFNIYYDRNIYKLNFDASGEALLLPRIPSQPRTLSLVPWLVLCRLRRCRVTPLADGMTMMIA